jgi:NAD-reducing hydrogenase small subunit
MTKPTFATTWLDGCSGCHMSFLDLDEKLLDLAQKVDVVYSPLVDVKEFPELVDITLVEGAVSSEDDLKKLRKIRAHTKVLVALGDCGINGNVPAMRNQFTPRELLKRIYSHREQSYPPMETVPALLATARPMHEFVKVDLHIPGCPPPPDAILFALTELLEGRMPELSARTRFGA